MFSILYTKGIHSFGLLFSFSIAPFNKFAYKNDILLASLKKDKNL